MTTPGSADLVRCPSCGSDEERRHNYCTRCGNSLRPASQVYRREADGTWSPLSDLDFSSMAPKPFPDRVERKRSLRKAAAVALLVVLLGVGLNIWIWRRSVRAERREAAEVTGYLNHPVGKIVPQFEIHYRRSVDGGLQITGTTNLPDQTTLDLAIYADKLLVAVDYPVTVRGGVFETRPLLERGRPFGAGSYQARIRAVFGKLWQSPSVLRVVGPLGERLEGPRVQRRDATTEAKLELTEDFVLN